ncbi:DUF2624 domain-containing protein [Ornithinibacillus salinisoli]|uniref:DUF2624 domain-containing protein n=1 Tax=Ornithinibacillus salinisoli TaxID=1848459 RepID=A0ABW4W302_9BACI
MSTFIKGLVISKMKQLTPEEIHAYGKDYGFTVTNKEARDIWNYLQNNKIDPFNKQDRNKMLKELARITNVETAKKANKLFQEIVKYYGLESLFEQ